MPKRDEVSAATRAAEQHDARVNADPDRMPTPEEEQAAERYRDLGDADVASHEREMLDRGANVKGEGEIV
jgi:hypothetical protein